MTLVSDFLSLFYPQKCAACNKMLYLHEKDICNHCYLNLPLTGYTNHRGNPIEQIFWGRVPIVSAASFLFFHKGSKVQRLLHGIKYKGRMDAGRRAGEWFGAILKSEDSFSTCEIIVPVPLHKKKLRERGYNQSLCFAEGLSKTMGIPVNTHVLQRVEYTSTQTKESKFSRWENVQSLFECTDNVAFKNKHVLLVDDVITTGATLEACTVALLKTEGIKISIASIAYAE